MLKLSTKVNQVFWGKNLENENFMAAAIHCENWYFKKTNIFHYFPSKNLKYSQIFLSETIHAQENGSRGPHFAKSLNSNFLKGLTYSALLPRLMLELRKALTTTGCRQLLQIDKNSSLQFVFVWSTLSFTPWMSDQRTFWPKKQKCVFVHQQFNMFSQHDLRPERIWPSSKSNLSARPSNCASPTSNCRVGKILRNKFWGNLTVQKWFHCCVGERLICLNDRIVFRPNK